MIDKNFEIYKACLVKHLGAEVTEQIILKLGGNNTVKKAVFNNTSDSGVAYDGSFTEQVIELTKKAIEINSQLPDYVKSDSSSIIKVCLLSHIAKCLLWEENDNQWEKTHRGILYKYIELDGALRVGERSILIAMNAGVMFTENEFEAMRIMDKSDNDDAYTKLHSSPLSMVVRQANELLNMINKHKPHEAQ